MNYGYITTRNLNAFWNEYMYTLLYRVLKMYISELSLLEHKYSPPALSKLNKKSNNQTTNQTKTNYQKKKAK